MVNLQKITHTLLKPLNGSHVPGVFLFIDTETSDFTDWQGVSQRFRLGWVCTWIRGEGKVKDSYSWDYFDDEIRINKFIDISVKRFGDVMLCGHNIFFDLQASGFFEYFTRWGWELDFYYDQGLTYIIRCNYKGAKLTIVSTTNWFDCSLKELGGLIKKEKKEIDFRSCTYLELKDYCRRDVEILVEAIKYYILFITDHGLGRFCLTKASQAFSGYRKRFMTEKIYLHGHGGAALLEREAYQGGRVEAFFIGKCPGSGFISLDVNGMYPFVMKSYEYPCKLVEYAEGQGIDRYKDILKSHAVVAEIEIDTPEPAFGIRYNKKMIFPVGQFECFVCSTGLDYALKRKYVKKIIRAAVYQKADLFTAYVDYFYKLRLLYKGKGNEIMQKLCKYMENSLYGKWGQKKVVSEITDALTGRRYFREEVLDTVNGGIVIQTYLMNKLIIQYMQDEGEHSFPAIAAHITENARFVLWKIMTGLGRERILYCDTDSIKIEEKYLECLTWLVDVEKLGALKVEGRSRSLEIGGAKNYRTETTRCIKGIPAGAEEVEPGLFMYKEFQRQVSHLRDGQIVGIKVDTVIKHIVNDYDKGIVHTDGHVEPFRLPFPAPQREQLPLPF